MAFPEPVEKLGQLLVEDVRDPQIETMLDILSGNDRSIIGKKLFACLSEAGVEGAHFDALRRFLIYVVDQVVAETLAFIEYHVTVKNIEVVVHDLETEDECGSGDPYRLKGTDMIAAEYHSGPGTWVEKYGKVHG